MDLENLTLEDRRRVLGMSPLLAMLGEAGEAALAEIATAVRYPRGHWFYRPSDPIEGRVVRVIASGRVQVIYAEVARRDGAKQLGPGALFGVEGALAEALGGEDQLHPESTTIAALTEEPTWVLELALDALPGAQAIVLQVGRLLERTTPRRTAALRAFALLRSLPHHTLAALCLVSHQHAISEGTGPVSLDPDLGRPRSLLVVDGHLHVECVDPGDPPHADSGLVLEGGPGSLLEVPAWAGRIAWRSSSATFLLSEGTQLAEHRRRDRSLHWALTRASGQRFVDLVLVLPGLGFDMKAVAVAALIRRLAASMPDALGDEAAVLELIEAGCLPRDDHQLPVDPEDLAASLAEALQAAWKDGPEPKSDVVLVDPTRLLGDGGVDASTLRQLVHGVELLAAQPPPGVLTSVSYLFDDPGQWGDTWASLGMPLRTHLLPTVFLSPAPAHSVLAVLLRDALTDFARTRRDFRDLVRRALPTPVAALMEEVRAQADLAGAVPTREAEPWPLRAVRLRVTPAVQTVLASASAPHERGTEASGPSLTDTQAKHLDAGLARWGRALTGRRVALALGGAGVQSYCAVPFIEELNRAEVPIDFIAGSSFGAYIAAFHAADPEGGLTELLDKWWCMELGILFGWWDSTPLSWWVTRATNGLLLQELEIPVIAVATSADLGIGVLLRDGPAGAACTASGALPPTPPVFRGGHRLLDGGLVLDLPTEVLFDSTAALVLSVNAVPPVDNAVPVPRLPIPGYALLLKLNPYLRMYDYTRAYLMLFNQAARIGEVYADVNFPARFDGTNAGYFWQAHRVVEAARAQPELKEATDAAVEHWTWLKGRWGQNPPLGVVA